MMHMFNIIVSIESCIGIIAQINLFDCLGMKRSLLISNQNLILFLQEKTSENKFN